MRRIDFKAIAFVDLAIGAALAGLLLLLAPGLGWVGIIAVFALLIIALSFFVEFGVGWRRRRALARRRVRATPPFR